MTVRKAIEKILRQRDYGEISYQEATDKILLLFDVSGTFSSEKFEQAYKDE